MKKLIALVLAVAMMLSITSAFAASEYDVTEPITITWWHHHEEQWNEYVNHVVDEFQKANPLITVNAIYIGGSSDLSTQFIAAAASGEVPAIVTCNTSSVFSYGAEGLCEVLDPYIEAYDYDMADFGDGLTASVTYDDEVVCLPELISTQVMYYNKTAAEAEGITMPTTLDEMDAFLKKATLFNADGTTKRYGTVFAGWDYWYTEMLYKNNGVNIVCEDGTSDANSEAAVAITKKMKEWIDAGYAYLAYGSGASTNMRQLFQDGGTFSVFHTSSLYDTYVKNVGDAFTVGMCWLPGGNDGVTKNAEVGGACILIPAKAPQEQKNAAWQFLMFLTSAETNLYFADKTGYFPTRASAKELPNYQEYLERKPDMAAIIDNSSLINPRPTDPRYDACAKLWRDGLATIMNDNAPIQETLDQVAAEINEAMADK